MSNFSRVERPPEDDRFDRSDGAISSLGLKAIQMKLTEARVLFLARESLAKLRDEGLAEISNFPLALRQAREIVAQFNEQGDEVDAIVRRKINSIKRGVVEGSNEWTLLYKRYRDEELRKKGPQR
jgi:hypothetical protein